MALGGRPSGRRLGGRSMGSVGLLIVGVLLFAFLFLPWATIVRNTEFLGIEGRDVTATAFDSGLGWVIAILLVALIAWEAALATGRRLQLGGISPAAFGAAIGALVAVLTVVLFLQSLADIAWGAFLGIVAGVAMGYASYLRWQESRGTAVGP